MTLFQMQMLHRVQRDETIIMTCEKIRIWEAAVMAYFKVLSQHLLGDTEKKHEHPQWCYP